MDVKVDSRGIYCFNNYISSKSGQDELSIQIVETFKKNNRLYYKKFFQQICLMIDSMNIKPEDLKKICVMGIPSHTVGKCKGNLKRLITDLCNKYKMIDGSEILYRHKFHKKSTEGGERSIESHINTIRIDEDSIAGLEYGFEDKIVWILDDITTSGSSLLGAKYIIFNNEAINIKRNNVFLIAIGKTYNEHYKNDVNLCDENLNIECFEIKELINQLFTYRKEWLFYGKECTSLIDIDSSLRKKIKDINENNKVMFDLLEDKINLWIQNEIDSEDTLENKFERIKYCFDLLDFFKFDIRLYKKKRAEAYHYILDEIRKEGCILELLDAWDNECIFKNTLIKSQIYKELYFKNKESYYIEKYVRSVDGIAWNLVAARSDINKVMSSFKWLSYADFTEFNHWMVSGNYASLCYKQFVSADNINSRTYNEVAYLYFSRGSIAYGLESALKFIDMAIEMDELQLDLLINRIFINLKKYSFEKVKDDIETIMKMHNTLILHFSFYPWFCNKEDFTFILDHMDKIFDSLNCKDKIISVLKTYKVTYKNHPYYSDVCDNQEIWSRLNRNYKYFGLSIYDEELNRLHEREKERKERERYEWLKEMGEL